MWTQRTFDCVPCNRFGPSREPWHGNRRKVSVGRTEKRIIFRRWSSLSAPWEKGYLRRICARRGEGKCTMAVTGRAPQVKTVVVALLAHELEHIRGISGATRRGGGPRRRGGSDSDRGDGLVTRSLTRAETRNRAAQAGTMRSGPRDRQPVVSYPSGRVQNRAWDIPLAHLEVIHEAVNQGSHAMVQRVHLGGGFSPSKPQYEYAGLRSNSEIRIHQPMLKYCNTDMPAGAQILQYKPALAAQIAKYGFAAPHLDTKYGFAGPG
ncbi:hypothetical protein DFH09DRAFT_1456703 [Mycena vulgaris]|nr:hypothetical protein DFH09DRAFT_1456703 [Mycena vulgaris]